MGRILGRTSLLNKNDTSNNGPPPHVKGGAPINGMGFEPTLCGRVERGVIMSDTSVVEKHREVREWDKHLQK